MPDSTLGTQINTPLARAFRQIITAGWANKSDGNVEAPTGHFALVTLNVNELKELIEAVFEDYEGEPVIYPGAYLVCEDNYGNTSLTEYLSDDAADRAFDLLSKEYATWDGQGGL